LSIYPDNVPYFNKKRGFYFCSGFQRNFLCSGFRPVPLYARRGFNNL